MRALAHAACRRRRRFLVFVRACVQRPRMQKRGPATTTLTSRYIKASAWPGLGVVGCWTTAGEPCEVHASSFTSRNACNNSRTDERTRRQTTTRDLLSYERWPAGCSLHDRCARACACLCLPMATFHPFPPVALSRVWPNCVQPSDAALPESPSVMRSAAVIEYKQAGEI